MRPARVVALVIGCLLVIPGVAMLVGGGALLTAYAVGRDDGYLTANLERVQTPTVAVRSEDLELLTDPGSPDWLLDRLDLDVRIAASSVGDGPELFVGIGPADDVEAYLDGVAHDEVVEVDGRTLRYERRDGVEGVAAPLDQDFWVIADTSTDPVVEWEPLVGDWIVVMMRADGAPGFSADVEVGVDSGAIVPVGVAVAGIGLVLIAAGVVLIVVSTRRDDRPDAPSPPAFAGIGDPPLSHDHPVAVSAAIDPDLSRGMWLVKWFLAIPHFLVLVVLWVGLLLSTVAAGVAILFTGRYPPTLFRYALGVLRWSWRVSYYAGSGGIGTDRYPPFSLGREPGYPAVLDIAYPEQLSRGLVLVKWWLLAIPHYLVVAVLAGGGFGWATDQADWTFEPMGGGLLGLLVLITGVVLLVTGRYPRSLFDLIVGLNRWILRVAAYALLLTDRYPPFRLDQGGPEPGSAFPPPTTFESAVTTEERS